MTSVVSKAEDPAPCWRTVIGALCEENQQTLVQSRRVRLWRKVLGRTEETHDRSLEVVEDVDQAVGLIPLDG